MKESMEISVVVPIYQNEDALHELCSRIRTSLASFHYEIVFVNDGSFDSSFETLELLSKKHYEVKHLCLAKNVGQQKATLEGLKVARGNYIAVLDGDLQDKPELILALYEKNKLKRGAVFVKRKGTYQSLRRMFTSVFIKKIVQLMSGLHYKAGSFYMFNKSILLEVTKIATDCKHPYLSIIIAQFAHSIDYIHCVREKRAGNSQYNFFKRIKAAAMAIYCSGYCTYAKLKVD